MTIRRTARFSVRPEGLEEALDAIRTFVAQTKEEAGTRMYASWRSAERPTEFLHLMEFEDAEAERVHASSDAVKTFTDTLYPLCAQPPIFEPWEPIDEGDA